MSSHGTREIPSAPLQLGERRAEHRHLLGIHDLGQGHHESLRDGVGLLDQRGEKRSSVRSALRRRSPERGLIRIPMKGGAVPAVPLWQPRRLPIGRAHLLLVGAVAVPVLEVETEVLDRLPLQLVHPRAGRPARPEQGRRSSPGTAERSRRRAQVWSALRASSPSLGAVAAVKR